jgi:porin
MLWRRRGGSDEGLGAYARIAPWLPGDRNPLDFYVAGGLAFKGPLPGRESDIFAVGANYAHASSGLRGAQADANRIAAGGGTPASLTPGPLPDYELGLEATYQIALAPWWKLQPDFQYIIHPGGSSAMPNAVVVGLRTWISF